MRGGHERPVGGMGASRHREAVDRILRFRGALGLALGQSCDKHGVLAGEPCLVPTYDSPPVCADRVRKSQRYAEGPA